MINNQTALLVIDVQKGLAETANFNSLIAKINQRIKSYREKDQPIIFMQHTDAELPYGSPAWMLAAKLAVQNEDQIFLKYHSDSFFETGLQNYLTNRQINQLEICGLQTEYCVDTAIRVGHHLGFKIKVLSGLHTTFDTPLLSAAAAIKYHEDIWNNSFAKVVQR
jgi:nicotinamidase-related amidase